MATVYDCYKTPGEWTMFDFREAWNDYRGADGYSILGNRDFMEFITPEAEEILRHRTLGKMASNYAIVAEELTKRHGEEYRVGLLNGCCQRDWQYIIYPIRFKGELKHIEQEYFNLCDEWKCVPEDGSESDGFYCFTYPLDSMDTEEQLKRICMCDEVVIHKPRLKYVWD